MLPENKQLAVYGAGRPTVLDQFAQHKPVAWLYFAPMVTWEDIERASDAHRKQRGHSVPRRVQRRPRGNDLPLIGLRPSLKSKPRFSGLS